MFEIGEVDDMPDFRAQEESKKNAYWDNVEAIVAAMQSHCITQKHIQRLLDNAGLTLVDVQGVKVMGLSTIEKNARRAV